MTSNFLSTATLQHEHVDDGDTGCGGRGGESGVHCCGRGVSVWLRRERRQPGEAEGSRDRGAEDAAAVVGGV